MWRYTGETPVMTIEKFKFVFGFQLENINSVILIERVLNPAIDELKNYL